MEEEEKELCGKDEENKQIEILASNKAELEISLVAISGTYCKNYEVGGKYQ